MTLTLHILSTGAQADRVNSIVMVGEALTIGRADTNDLVLPDPTREISSSHAVLQTHGADYQVVDTSTNGTFLNSESSALGDLPSPLNNGDTLRIGPYEMRVEIDGTALDLMDALPAPMDATPIMDPNANPLTGDVLAEVASIDHDGGDFLDDLLGAAPPNAMNTPTRDVAHGGAEVINEFLDVAPDENLDGGASAADHSAATRDYFAPNAGDSAIPDDWDDDFLSGDENPFAPPAANGATPDFTPEPPAPVQVDVAPNNPPPQPEPVAEVPEPAVAPVPVVEQTQPAPEPVVAKPAAVSPETKPIKTPPATSGPNPARGFLEAAGVDHSRINDEELAEIMTRSGTVFRTLIEGAREVLMARNTIKDELRLEKTTISPDGNNPIKFSISGRQAVEAMVKPSVPGYKAGPASAEEAMADIKAHEVAMMSGMENAIKSLLGRFNPDTLAKKIEKDGGKGGFLKGKKARYWEVFESLYGQISEEAEEDFHSLFGKEFAKAYAIQMKTIKASKD